MSSGATDPLVRPSERWEVGGEFDAVSVSTEARIPWPSLNRMYGLATHALIAALESAPLTRGYRFYVPDYFCPEVVETWRRFGIAVTEYLDDPRWSEPDWSSLTPDPGEAVLAVNYFGIRGEGNWLRWRRANPDVLVVEDHSHDPLSPWAQRSNADFAFASLRKSMPVTDGAILWSPRGHALPEPPEFDPANGTPAKREAMRLKRAYLAGSAVDKDVYRALQIGGERELLASSPCSISSWSAEIVRGGMPATWRERRRRNVRTLMDSLASAKAFKQLTRAWRRGQCPFNLILLFESKERRDACRARLVDARIFPPVHWDQPQEASERARELGSRILTIPADQRYGDADMRRVSEVLVAFDRHTRAKPGRTSLQ